MDPNNDLRSNRVLADTEHITSTKPLWASPPHEWPNAAPKRPFASERQNRNLTPTGPMRLAIRILILDPTRDPPKTNPHRTLATQKQQGHLELKKRTRWPRESAVWPSRPRAHGQPRLKKQVTNQYRTFYTDSLRNTRCSSTRPTGPGNQNQLQGNVATAHNRQTHLFGRGPRNHPEATLRGKGATWISFLALYPDWAQSQTVLGSPLSLP